MVKESSTKYSSSAKQGITVLGHAPDEEEDELFVSVGETVRHCRKRHVPRWIFLSADSFC